MGRREFLFGAAVFALTPVAVKASRTVARPSLRDDPETRTTRNWIGLGFGAVPVAYLVWKAIGMVANRWRRMR